MYRPRYNTIQYTIQYITIQYKVAVLGLTVVEDDKPIGYKVISVTCLGAWWLSCNEVSRSPKVGLPISGNLGVRMSRSISSKVSCQISLVISRAHVQFSAEKI